MNSDKHGRVCSICGQGFTRNSSATRHNINLHSGEATIVRPYEYIIGRLKGEFPPGDPSIYRRDLKNRTGSLIRHHPYYAYNNFRPLPETRTDTWERVASPSTFQRPTDHPNQPFNPRSTTPISQPNALLARKAKLRELQALLYRNYLPQTADQILTGVTYLAKEANDDVFLDLALRLQQAKIGGGA